MNRDFTISQHSIRKRGTRNPVWELQWWEDYIKPDGTIGRKRESTVLVCASKMSIKQARKEAEKTLSHVQRRQGSAVLDAELARICRTVFCALVFSRPETLDPEALSFNSRHAPVAGIWRNAVLRYGTVVVQRSCDMNSVSFCRR